MAVWGCASSGVYIATGNTNANITKPMQFSHTFLKERLTETRAHSGVNSDPADPAMRGGPRA